MARLIEADLVENRTIYQSCRISWVVKNDPDKEVVVVPAMAVIHLVTSGDEKGLVQAAEYYMDPTGLIAAFSRAG